MQDDEPLSTEKKPKKKKRTREAGENGAPQTVPSPAEKKNRN